jgi:2-polyprenyl-6-methoxyphenol hydroxylase-like FAD-dependent oxidoreductase
VAAVGPDGEPEVFQGDLIVGADGVHSTVRAGLPGDPGVRLTGWAAWRGITGSAVSVGSVGETWGDGQLFGITVLGDGRIYWFAGARTPPGSAIADEKAALLQRFEGWHPPIGTLIRGTPTAAVSRHDIVTIARPLGSFVTGRTVLVGDAAHAMTPNLGQGGNQGLEDAVTLVRAATAAWLSSGARLDAALGWYDHVRRARTAPLQRRSELMGRIALLQHPAAVAVRDLVLRATPASATARAAAAVTAWRPPPLR